MSGTTWPLPSVVRASRGHSGLGARSPPRRGLQTPIGAALALMVFVGACTSSGTQISLVASESNEDPEALGYAPAGEEITEGAPTITVRAGEEVTVTLENLHGQYFEVPAATHHRREWVKRGQAATTGRERAKIVLSPSRR